MTNNFKHFSKDQQQMVKSNIYLDLMEQGFNSLEITQLDILQIANILVSFTGSCITTKQQRIDAINYWLAH